MRPGTRRSSRTSSSAADRAAGGRKGRRPHDAVGRTTIKQSIQAVRHRGTCVLYGNSSGLVETIAPMELGSIYFTRPRLAHHMRTREEVVRRTDDISGAMQDGTLRVALARVFPLAQAAEAHRLLQSRATIGKILLSMD